MKTFNLEQGTRDWLLWRESGIGASESSAAAGLNPYCSPVALFDQKTRRAGADPDNKDMARGRELEPMAREIYEGLYGVKVPPLCAVHDQYPWLKASLDGYSPEDGGLIVEIKAPREHNHRKAVDGEIPEYYRCQMQHQLLVTGASRCHFLSYCPAYHAKSKRLVELDVKPDKDFQEWLLKVLVRFWARVEANEPPPEGFPWD